MAAKCLLDIHLRCITLEEIYKVREGKRRAGKEEREKERGRIACKIDRDRERATSQIGR